ncbi:hypothetical protein FRC05_001779 [Tulasnella sp. 425]|nr:hypothetical protein FRC05_001779 [Tulasnella sp. 425]
MRLVISSLLTLATAALAAADGPFFNPPPSAITSGSNPSPASSRAQLVGRMTNAKRLSMGLPPLKPKSLHRGTRVGSAPRGGPSMTPPVPWVYSLFQHVPGTDGTDYGFISPVWNGFGEYGQVQSSQDSALVVTFNVSPDASSTSQLDFTADNSPSATYPFFGAIDGFASTSDNLGPGSYNYAYIGGTTQTPAGSPPNSGGDNSFTAATGIPEDIESAVWTYDASTNAITAQWINTDGSSPATHIVYANDANQAFALTGDVGSFQSTFGVPYPEITFTCVAPLPVQPTKK